jgi:uncharacterized membrane protein
MQWCVYSMSVSIVTEAKCPNEWSRKMVSIHVGDRVWSRVYSTEFVEWRLALCSGCNLSEPFVSFFFAHPAVYVLNYIRTVHFLQRLFAL